MKYGGVGSGKKENKLQSSKHSFEDLNSRDEVSSDFGSGSGGEIRKFLPNRTQEIGRKKQKGALEIKEEVGFDIEEEIKLSSPVKKKDVLPVVKKDEGKGRAIWDDIEFDEN